MAGHGDSVCHGRGGRLGQSTRHDHDPGSDRHGEIPAKLLTYPGPPRADVLLSDRYSPRKRYPLIVLLPGFSNTYAIHGPSMLDAQHVLAGRRAPA